MADHSMYLLEQKQSGAGTICAQILVALPIPTNVSVVAGPSTSTIASSIQTIVSVNSSSSHVTPSHTTSPISSVSSSSSSIIKKEIPTSGPKLFFATKPLLQGGRQVIFQQKSSISPSMKIEKGPFPQHTEQKPISDQKQGTIGLKIGAPNTSSTKPAITQMKTPTPVPTPPQISPVISNAKLDTSLGSLSDSSSSSFQNSDPANHDSYCIICHQTDLVKKSKGSLLYCSKCQISAHRKHFGTPWIDGVCHECTTLEHAKANSRFNGSGDKLAQLLKHTVEILAEDCDVEEFDEYLVQNCSYTLMKIKFSSITNKVKNREYKKIEQFEFDIRLFEHNLIITKNRRISARKNFMNRYRQELEDIYTCHYCYQNFYNTTSTDKYYGFNLSCPEGHSVVWLYNDWFRVYWPAKVYKSLDSKFDYEFRFFGARKMETQKGNTDSEKVLSYSKKEPKNNASLFKKFAQLDKQGINLRQELNEAMQCVKEYLKAFDYEVPNEPSSLPKVIKNLKFSKSASKRLREQSPDDSKESQSHSVASSTDISTIPESDDDCVILDTVKNEKKLEGRNRLRASSDAEKKAEALREPIKLVINTKTNIIKPTTSTQKDLKDMSYEDLLFNDLELRKCIETLSTHLEKTTKNIELFNESAFASDLPTVKKLKDTIEDHINVISEFPKRLCDSCQRNEVDLKYFCCQYGIYCCDYCQKDDKAHVKFCLKTRQTSAS